MSNWVTHGFIGIGVRLATLVPFDPSVEVNIAGAIFGFVAGSAPDTFDWIVAKFGWQKRWTLYRRMHADGDLSWIGIVLWDYGSHLVVDMPFHEKPGEKWWPRLWWLEVGITLMAIGMDFILLNIHKSLWFQTLMEKLIGF